MARHVIGATAAEVAQGLGEDMLAKAEGGRRGPGGPLRGICCSSRPPRDYKARHALH